MLQGSLLIVILLTSTEAPNAWLQRNDIQRVIFGQIVIVANYRRRAVLPGHRYLPQMRLHLALNPPQASVITVVGMGTRLPWSCTSWDGGAGKRSRALVGRAISKHREERQTPHPKSNEQMQYWEAGKAECPGRHWIPPVSVARRGFFLCAVFSAS